MKSCKLYIFITTLFLFFVSCGSEADKKQTEDNINNGLKSKISAYQEISLDVDLSELTVKQKQLIVNLIKISEIMDEIFWSQSYGKKEKLLKGLEDKDSILYVQYNYGPWDRLDGMKPFVKKCGMHPLGARFYPPLIDLESFEKIDDDAKFSEFTLIRKDNDGSLYVVPYSQAYMKQNIEAAQLLKDAATLTEDEQLREYLLALAEGLLYDKFDEVFRTWLELKTNRIDFIAGPIDPYEDQFLSTKAAHASLVLLRDVDWSKKLEKFASTLPELQKELPVPDKYKAEVPVTNSDLGVYDVVYAAGRYNTGGKKIALNLPLSGCPDCKVNSRKLQLRNVMKAKFDKILKPIGELVLDDEQKGNINFDAFFENTMFYEVGNFLGPKTTVNNKGKVSKALKEHYFVLEELKSDALSLFFITKLYKTDIFSGKNILDNYVTYMADIFRSIRFGVTNPQAKANTMRFYYFKEAGAFTKNNETGKYKVDLDKMIEAVTKLAEEVIVIQGDGDYSKAKEMIEKYGVLKEELDKDIEMINAKGIPKDVVFKQGEKVLGL